MLTRRSSLREPCNWLLSPWLPCRLHRRAEVADYCNLAFDTGSYPRPAAETRATMSSPYSRWANERYGKIPDLDVHRIGVFGVKMGMRMRVGMGVFGGSVLTGGPG